MSAPRRRVALLLGATLVATGLALPLTAGVALAAPPTTVALTETAARHYGDGGPATSALLAAQGTTVDGTGALVLFDGASHDVRRVDPSSGVISVLAGNGSAPTTTGCSIDTTLPATQVPIPQAEGLWSTTNGDLLLWLGVSNRCSFGNVYRLDHTDLMWHLALASPDGPCCNSSKAYTTVTADPAGNLFAFDAQHAVLRAFAPGDSPSGPGTVIAGVLDAQGQSGDGGAAVAAQLSEADVLAAAADGSIVLSGANHATVRRIDASGTITTVAGTGAAPASGSLGSTEGQPAASTPLSVKRLQLSADGGTVFVQNRDQGGSVAVQSFTPGGSLTTVAGPAAPFPGHLASAPSGALVLRGTDLLAGSGGGSVRAWPLDGSKAPVAGTLVAGLDDNDGAGVSSDGAPLSSAFVPNITALAAAGNGTLALATPRGIRTLTGLGATDALGTLAPLDARELGYAADGTLYALASGYTPSLVAISPAGVSTTLLGTGTSLPAEGANGPDVALNVNAHMAVDPASRVVYFDTGTDRVWSVNQSGIVHLVAGNATSGQPHEGGAAITEPLENLRPGSLAVDASTHALYLASVHAHQVHRIDGDGSIHTLDCTMSCPLTDLSVTPDGSLLGGIEPVLRGANGATSSRIRGLIGARTVLADGRVAGTLASHGSQNGGADGGLLALTEPVTAPVFPDGAPSASAVAEPAGFTVSVSPSSTTQTVLVYGVEVPTDGTAPGSGTLLAVVPPEASPTAHSLTYRRLAAQGTNGQAVLGGHTYRLSVVATETNAQTGATLASAPQVITLVPTADVTAPAAPGLALTGLHTVQVTLPADADLSSVELRVSEGSTAPSSVTDGTFAGTFPFGWGSPQSGNVPLSPYKAFTFAAFAVDTSGNASPAITVASPAAALVTGDAVTMVGYQPQGAGTDVWWTGGFALGVRYAPGTTPPANPEAGTALGQVSSVWGNSVNVPVAKGAKVAVSVFRQGDTAATYRRTAFVLTGGTASDTFGLTAAPVVTYGKAPAVSVSYVRHTPLGQTLPLSGQAVTLYRRAVGATTWTVVKGGSTDAAGKLAFAVPVPTVATEYQARSTGLSSVAYAPVARTTINQIVSATYSKTTLARKTPLVVTGAVTPHRRTHVSLQRLVSGRWTTLTTVLTATNGTYRITYTPTAAGAYSLRVLSVAANGCLATASAARSLRVT